jgi:DNA/RNA-binding domain of Phe-tRNA-synthetase-like protein
LDETLILSVSDSWKIAYPDAYVGLLALRHVANPESHAGLGRRKQALEADLRLQYASYDRVALRLLPVLKAYHNYYKRFEKTYHVQLQLESVVFKGKPIPSVAALVECMFMAELKGLLLTSGHDLELLHLPLRLEAARGDERYTLYNGQEQVLKAGDMFIADTQGVISSVIYGPDQRTRIRPETNSALFSVYAPPGIASEAIMDHLRELESNVRLISPELTVEELAVYS